MSGKSKNSESIPQSQICVKSLLDQVWNFQHQRGFKNYEMFKHAIYKRLIVTFVGICTIIADGEHFSLFKSFTRLFQAYVQRSSFWRFQLLKLTNPNKEFERKAHEKLRNFTFLPRWCLKNFVNTAHDSTKTFIWNFSRYTRQLCKFHWNERDEMREIFHKECTSTAKLKW